MNDCYANVPWPADLSTSETSSEGSLPECPKPESMRLVVVFLRMLYGNDRSVVTSLKPASGSPITVVNCDGLPANVDNALTGDLELGLNLQLLEDPVVVNGGQVYKQITNEFKFRKGWVTEGVRIGFGPLTINSTNSRVLTSSEKTALDLPPTDTSLLHQGLITLSYDDQLVEREISPQIIRLSDTVERLYKDIPYLGFPEGQNSLVRVRLNVPASNLGQFLEMKIRVQLFGRTTGLLPEMTMSYRRLPRPSPNPVALTPSDFEYDIDFTVPTTSLAIDTMVEIESESFCIKEGDTILVTLARNGASDSYNAEVGMLRMSGIVNVSSTCT
jgi:hypothetical protein